MEGQQKSPSYYNGRFMNPDIIEAKGFPQLKFLCAMVVGRMIQKDWMSLTNVPNDIVDYGLSVCGEFEHRFRMAYNILIQKVDLEIWRYIFEVIGVSNFRKYHKFNINLQSPNLFPTFMIDAISINSIIHGFRDRKTHIPFGGSNRTWVIHDRSKVPRDFVKELNCMYEDYGLLIILRGKCVLSIYLHDEKKFLKSDRYQVYLGTENDPLNSERTFTALKNCVVS